MLASHGLHCGMQTVRLGQSPRCQNSSRCRPPPQRSAAVSALLPCQAQQQCCLCAAAARCRRLAYTAQHPRRSPHPCAAAPSSTQDAPGTEAPSGDWEADRDAAARAMFSAMPGVKSYQGPPPDQEPAPFGLQPDLDDGPSFEDAFEEKDPELRAEGLENLARQAGFPPGAPVFRQPPVSQRSDYIPHELVTFTEDEITHSVSVTVAAPLPTVFAFWKERTGYVKWFDLIHQAAELSISDVPTGLRVAAMADEEGKELPRGQQAQAGHDFDELRTEAAQDAARAVMAEVGAAVLEQEGMNPEEAGEQAYAQAGEALSREGVPELANLHALSLFLFYRWGHMPPLELFTCLERREVMEDSFILEQSVEGMALAAGANFSEAEGGGTQVELRVAYYLPEQLKQYVGPVGVYADVDEILQQNMQTMKAYIESTPLEDHQAWCGAERRVAEQHAAGFEGLMTASDLEQAVVDSVVADLDRLTGGANQVTSTSGRESSQGASRFRTHNVAEVDGLRTSLLNIREILLGREAAEVPGMAPHDAGQLQVMASWLADKPELQRPFLRGIARGLAFLDGDASAADPRPEPPEPSAEAMDRPSREASAPVGPGEANEDAQVCTDYPTDVGMPPDGLQVGEGQEAEASVAQYTTPVGPVKKGATPKAGQAKPRQRRAARGKAAASAEPQSGEPSAQPEAKPKRRRKKQEPSGTTPDTQPGSPPQEGKRLADEATPAGPVNPKQ